MATLTAVQDHLGAWIPQVQGRYIDEDFGYGAQCWDLAAHWSTYLGLPVINTGGPGRWPGWAGNMVDAYPQTPAIGAAYELVGSDSAGQPGDIAVWGDGYAAYYPKTHVAVLVRDTGNGWLTCMSQNSTPARADNPYPGASTGPTTLQALPKRGLIGYLRPRASLSAQGTLTEEDDMALTDDDVLRIARASAKETLNWAVTQEVDGKTVHTAALSWFLLSAADAAVKDRELTVAAVVEAYGNKRLPKIGADGKPNPNDYTTPNLEDSWAAYNAAQSRALIEQLAVKQGVTIDYDLIAQKVADELGARLGGN